MMPNKTTLLILPILAAAAGFVAGRYVVPTPPAPAVDAGLEIRSSNPAPDIEWLVDGDELVVRSGHPDDVLMVADQAEDEPSSDAVANAVAAFRIGDGVRVKVGGLPTRAEVVRSVISIDCKHGRCGNLEPPPSSTAQSGSGPSSAGGGRIYDNRHVVTCHSCVECACRRRSGCDFAPCE